MTKENGKQFVIPSKKLNTIVTTLKTYSVEPIMTGEIVRRCLYKVNNEVIPILSKLDMEQVNKTIGVVEEAVEDFDVESLNSAVTELTKAVEAFDIDALNEAIDSLNTTIQPLKSFVQLFGKK